MNAKKDVIIIDSIKNEDIENVAINFANDIITSMTGDNQKPFVASKYGQTTKNAMFNSNDVSTLVISFTDNQTGYKNFKEEDKKNDASSTAYSINAKSLNKKEKTFFDVLDKTLNILVNKNIADIKKKLNNKSIREIVPFVSSSAIKNDEENENENRYLKLAITANYAQGKFVEGYKTKFYSAINNDVSKSEEKIPKNSTDLENLLKSGITGKCIIKITKILNNQYTAGGFGFRLSFSLMTLHITSVSESSNNVYLDLLGIKLNTDVNNTKNVELKSSNILQELEDETKDDDEDEEDNEDETKTKNESDEEESDDDEEIVVPKQQGNKKLSRKN